jgi:hypothetical protein
MSLVIVVFVLKALVKTWYQGMVPNTLIFVLEDLIYSRVTGVFVTCAESTGHVGIYSQGICHHSTCMVVFVLKASVVLAFVHEALVTLVSVQGIGNIGICPAHDGNIGICHHDTGTVCFLNSLVAQVLDPISICFHSWCFIYRQYIQM